MRNELYHHGILGQKWGIRRYQNADGTLTAAGKQRYGVSEKARTSENYQNKLNDISEYKGAIVTQFQKNQIRMNKLQRKIEFKKRFGKDTSDLEKELKACQKEKSNLTKEYENNLKELDKEFKKALSKGNYIQRYKVQKDFSDANSKFLRQYGVVDKYKVISNDMTKHQKTMNVLLGYITKYADVTIKDLSDYKNKSSKFGTDIVSSMLENQRILRNQQMGEMMRHQQLMQQQMQQQIQDQINFQIQNDINMMINQQTINNTMMF